LAKTFPFDIRRVRTNYLVFIRKPYLLRTQRRVQIDTVIPPPSPFFLVEDLI